MNESLAGLHLTAFTGSSLLSLTDQTWRPVRSSHSATVAASCKGNTSLRPISTMTNAYRVQVTYRIDCNVVSPNILLTLTALPPLWPKKEPPDYLDSAEIPRAVDLLVEMELAAETTQSPRKLKLFRFCDGTDRRFRLVITATDAGGAAAEPRPIDFDISTACLIPCYVLPDESGPLELVLNDGREMRRLRFHERSHLYKFQQALTGYEVVDGYMA